MRFFITLVLMTLSLQGQISWPPQTDMDDRNPCRAAGGRVWDLRRQLEYFKTHRINGDKFYELDGDKWVQTDEPPPIHYYYKNSASDTIWYLSNMPTESSWFRISGWVTSLESSNQIVFIDSWDIKRRKKIPAYSIYHYPNSSKLKVGEAVDCLVYWTPITTLHYTPNRKGIMYRSVQYGTPNSHSAARLPSLTVTTNEPTPIVPTNTPPVVTNVPTVVTNVPTVVTNTPPVVTNTVPQVITNFVTNTISVVNISNVNNILNVTNITTIHNQTVVVKTQPVAVLIMEFNGQQILLTPVLPVGVRYYFKVYGRYALSHSDRGEYMHDAAFSAANGFILGEKYYLARTWRWNGDDMIRPTFDLYQPDHIYYYHFTGKGRPEIISFTDISYSDNFGQLIFELYER